MKSFLPRTTGRQVAAFALLLALSACSSSQPSITPFAETEPMPSAEDAADDPAIWISPGYPAQSRVLGTDKQTGLYVYNLEGKLLQTLAVGPLNNVDLRQNVNGADYAVATEDVRNVVVVFEIERASGIVRVVGEFPSGKPEPYGICLGAEGGSLLVVVTYKDGEIRLHRLTAPAAGSPLEALAEKTVKLPSQLEGCVVDEHHRRLFVGEEAVGVHAFDLDALDKAPVLIDRVGGPSGLTADVEGVTLWRGRNGEGWLVVSSQGSDSYVVYDRAPPHQSRGSFRISGATAIDRATGTDGIDVVSVPLGPQLSRGLLVAQDDRNTQPDANQNFKYVDWAAVETALTLPALTAE